MSGTFASKETIDYFRITHNTLCLSPKFGLIVIVFTCSKEMEYAILSFGKGVGSGENRVYYWGFKNRKKRQTRVGTNQCFSPHGRANKLLPSSSRISYKFGTFKITNLRYSHRKQLNLSSVHKWSYSAGVSSLSTRPSRSYVTRKA